MTVEKKVLAGLSTVEERILTALAETPPRIPVLIGGCGSGRTTMLHYLRDRLGPGTEHIDVERIATTPEGFLASVTESTRCHLPKSLISYTDSPSARAAFDRTCDFFEHARNANGTNVTFLLDEALDIRIFESFPGLRDALREFWRTLCGSPNKFVLTTRFITRSLRLFRDASDRFEFVLMPPLTVTEGMRTITELNLGKTKEEKLELCRIVHALTDGRPHYLKLLAEGTVALGGDDPVSALAAQLAPGAPISMACRFSYELRLHRARGYGALRGILRILSLEEPLTLTEVAQHLNRTPGSTKDYLSWLEDVDLIVVKQKRYRFADPMLRLWVNLHGQATPPDKDDLTRGVRDYAARCIPYKPASPVKPERRKANEQLRGRSLNIVEID